MDTISPISLIPDGKAGLDQIAEAFRSEGWAVMGVYLIQLTSHEGAEEWVVRVIADAPGHIQRKMIYDLVKLRRDKKLPLLDPLVRIEVVRPDHAEAARIMEYTRGLGGAPAIIRNAVWKGMFIEYAFVAEIPKEDRAVA